jgi:hypothetical protein
LGLNPTTLSEGLLEEVTLIASKYRHRVDPSKIICRSVWRKGMEVAPDLQVSIADDAPEIEVLDVADSVDGFVARPTPGTTGKREPRP